MAMNDAILSGLAGRIQKCTMRIIIPRISIGEELFYGRAIKGIGSTVMLPSFIHEVNSRHLCSVDFCVQIAPSACLARLITTGLYRHLALQFKAISTPFYTKYLGSISPW